MPRRLGLLLNRRPRSIVELWTSNTALSPNAFERTMRSENFIVINNQVYHPILAKAARFQVLGKSPAGFYLRLNKQVWERLPSRVRNLHALRSYGVWLHSLLMIRPPPKSTLVPFTTRSGLPLGSRQRFTSP